MMLAAIDGTVGAMGPGGYIVNPGAGGGYGSAFYSPQAPSAPRVGPLSPGGGFGDPGYSAPYINPRPYIETSTPTNAAPTPTPAPQPSNSTPGPAVTDPWGGVVGALGNFWNALPSAPPAPNAPISAAPVDTTSTDKALSSLLDLASSQFASAGGQSAATTGPAALGSIDPSLLGGGGSATVAPTGAVAAPATSAGPNKVLIIVALLVVSGIGYWLYQRHKKAA